MLHQYAWGGLDDLRVPLIREDRAAGEAGGGIGNFGAAIMILMWYQLWNELLKTWRLTGRLGRQGRYRHTLERDKIMG